MSKRILPFLLFTTLLTSPLTNSVQAKEGMWRPGDLKKQEAEMKKLGLKIPVTDLYNDGKTAYNDAVVLFGSGCTGEIVSPNGLLFTNHHCGYGAVQGVSSNKDNYIINGFWAKNNKEEIPCPGLQVTFIKKLEDVTKLVLRGIDTNTTEAERKILIANNIKKLQSGFKKTTGFDGIIKPYYNGNEYWITLQETYRDIRLVGFPPNGIGKFGGDTDNWMWPRQTGDFGIFRVYADANGKPADFNETNKPLKTPKFFNINIGGIEEGDYTMVYGFPGTTQEYLTASQLNQVQNLVDPIRITARDKKLGVWNEEMKNDSNIFLKYASKQASVANGWKKWQGEVKGLTINDVYNKKKAYEQKLMSRVQVDSSATENDKLILAQIESAVSAANPYVAADELTRETVLGVEIIQQAGQLDKLMEYYRNPQQAALTKIQKSFDNFYKNYDISTDHKVWDTLMPYYFEGNEITVPTIFKNAKKQNGARYIQAWGNNIFSNSVIADNHKINELIANANPQDSTIILNDPAYQTYQTVQHHLNTVVKPVLDENKQRMEILNRSYMAQQLKYMSDERTFFPDANMTLRVTYGKVDGIKPQGSTEYSYFSTLEDVIKKHNPSIAEFNVPQKLIDIHQSKNYGRWAVNGTVPVTFIGSNHTTGGNSGSPVLNDKGQLIGINFDRIWDGTMSDLYYDPNLCRNIAVDIRYVLFIIEKFGDAGWLLNEMKLVK